MTTRASDRDAGRQMVERAAAHYAADLADLWAWAALPDPTRGQWDPPTAGEWMTLERGVTLGAHDEAAQHAGTVGTVLQHRESGRDVLVIGGDVLELPGGYMVAVEQGTLRLTERLRHFVVRADAYTGAWIDAPEERGSVARDEWAARVDTYREHFDTIEAAGETVALTVWWVT